jgi:hypothetical protein
MKELYKEIELTSLMCYAQSIGVDNIEIKLSTIGQNQEQKAKLYKLIDKRLEEILLLNGIVPTAEFTEVCAYADAINAQRSHCQLNDTNCVRESIKLRIMEILQQSIIHNLKYAKYLNNIKELYELYLQECNNVTQLINQHNSQETNQHTAVMRQK